MKEEIKTLIEGYKVDIRILQKGSDKDKDTKVKLLKSVISDLESVLRG